MDSVIFVLSLKRIVNFSDLASSDVFPFGNRNDFPSSNDENFLGLIQALPPQKRGKSSQFPKGEYVILCLYCLNFVTSVPTLFYPRFTHSL